MEQQIAGLTAIPRGELVALFKRVEPRRSLPVTRGEIEMAIRCRLQQQLISKLRSKMTQAAIAAELILSVLDTDTGHTELLRSWRGMVHSVSIVEGGVFYDGCLYRSLDAVTQKITGKRRCGAEFFGVPAEGKSP